MNWLLTGVVVEEGGHVVDGEIAATVARQQARLADVAVADHDALDRPTDLRRPRHLSLSLNTHTAILLTAVNHSLA